MTTYAIGDVHGCLPELEEAFRRIEDEETFSGAAGAKIVMLGDYVDRGPDSKGVVDFLMRKEVEHGDALVCLMGNHDAMLAESVSWPDYQRETLASYSVDSVDSLGEWYPEHLAWLKNLKPYHEDEAHYYVHAGMLPSVKIEDQTIENLTWLRDHWTHDHGKVVVCGHTPVFDASEPNVLTSEDGKVVRVMCDGGCCFGHSLLVAKFDPLVGAPVGSFHVPRKRKPRP